MSMESAVSPQWIEAAYRLWREKPEELGADWRAFFAGFELASGMASQDTTEAGHATKEAAVQSLLYRYRDLGHLKSHTDPLSEAPPTHPELELRAFDLSEADLDTRFLTLKFIRPSATLREVLESMEQTYCRHIGVEFMHIQSPAERQWLKDRMEPCRNSTAFDLQQQKHILLKLIEAGRFESFLHRKFQGQKRFSLEGGEALIPLLNGILHLAAAGGVGDLVLGMPHRGRLNVLTHIFGKPLQNIFSEFRDNLELNFVGEGDVKYHKGYSADLTTKDGHRLHLTLAANPSHLEAVNPVVIGKCRARQESYGPGGERRVLPVLLHGDAAFAGQGMVPETLNLSQLKGYRTGGTLHIVLNNQIGFTTLPEAARSTRYATDVAKMLMVPVFHVHGEDPEALLHVAALALDYRQSFGKDVVIEMICYRKHGHNEGDEPFFTQPRMYEKIQKRAPAFEIYAERLLEQGMERAEIDGLIAQVDARLEASLDTAPLETEKGFSGKWAGIETAWSPVRPDTAVDENTLRETAERINRIPPGFSPHPKVAQLFQRRLEALQQNAGLDWGAGEALAFATLLSEGASVRLSGQDSRRGTFNHRHAVLVDTETEALYAPAIAVARSGATFSAYNSMLSEAAVLGFEYGYSLEHPRDLVIWEAQFGDFANGAQVIIDQFIAGGQTKWDRSSGLVMLLPHGFEGQGPEHSSARIERYLQLCAQNNLMVAYPSNPAQVFHLLRRQIRLPYRRPLIVFTPKSLLRHPSCRSSLSEFSRGRFREIIADPVDASGVRAALLCSGKIYYDLLQRKKAENREDLALIRIEQFYPLAEDLLQQALEPFSKTLPLAWVQEEPENAGAWGFLRPQLTRILGREPAYIGRAAAASPAVGSHRLHGIEQARVLEEAFALAWEPV